MKSRTTIAIALLAAGLGASQVAATTIDDFQLAQSVDSGATAASEAIPGAGEIVLGNARDLAVDSNGAAVTAAAGGGQLSFQVPFATEGTVVAVWDGQDGEPLVLDPDGLGGVDLTDGGGHDALVVPILSATGVTLVIEVHSDTASWSAFGFVVPNSASPAAYLLPYSAFATGAGGGARFDDVGAVVVRVEGSDDAGAVLGPITTTVASPQIVVSQRDLDATALGGGTGTELGSTPRSPGSYYTLTMTISNTGDEATGVSVDELLDPDLTIIGGFRSTPIVRDDRYSSCLSAPVVADGSFANGLIEGAGNDIDPDGQSLSVVAVQTVSELGGTVTLDDAATGRFTYLPPPGVTGVDRFAYTVADIDGTAVDGAGRVSRVTADPCAGCDHDGDGYLHPACGGSDCDDFRPDVHPGADEVCDGVDNNCDGDVDEGFPADCIPCDFIEHQDCTPGDVRACGTDVGMCVAGTEVCDATGSWSGACDGSVEPVPEVPNGLDDNCDGTADEDQWPITTPCPDVGDAWRVMAGAAPGGNGLTWATAFATIDVALAAAASCDEVWVSGAHTLPATVVIDSPIRIYGGFDGTELTRAERDPEANVTTFDGGGAVRCFSITAGTLLDGVTVANCYEEATREGGGIDLHGAALHARDVVFTNNIAWSGYWGDRTWGGAVHAFEASLSIEGSWFEGNVSRWHGGAIYAEDSDVVVHDSAFVDNHSDDWTGSLNIYARGGAIMAIGSGTLTVTGSTFERNWCSSEGSAIFAQGPAVTVTGSMFVENVRDKNVVELVGSVAVIQGSVFERNGIPFETSGNLGIVDADDGAQVIVSECEFLDNDNLALSGTTFSSEITTMEVRDSVFDGNFRSLYTGGVRLVVSNTRFEHGRYGGYVVEATGIQAPWGVVSFTGCTFADNLGPAMRLSFVDAVIDRSVLARNAGHFFGGALDLNRYADLTVTNSLIVDNYCGKDGAAAFVYDHSTLTLEHVTLVGNTMADTFGGAIRAEYFSEITASNIILWGNWPRAVMRDNSSTINPPTTSVVPDGYYWSDPSYANLIGDPGLVNPANGDFRLAAWSAALDIAAPGPVTVDFDGRTRDFDGDGDGIGEPDPGAYEYVDTVPNLPPVAVAVDDVLVDANGIPLTDALLSSDRTCDPNGDFLNYAWYGPGGLLSAADPQVLLPQGTSLLTLVTDDGTLPSNPVTIEVHVEPCQDLTAIRTGSDAQLTWTQPTVGKVFRARDTEPNEFGLIAMAASSGFVDAPPAEVEVALYGVVSDGCASNVVAVYVGDTPPANSPPVIWSAPADYSDSMQPPFEPVTLVTARFGIPYGYHVRAADPDGDELAFSLVDGPTGAVLDSDGLLTWLPDLTGLHPVSIEVSDGNGGSATQEFSIQVDNRAPKADAGRSFTLSESGVTVTLNGSASSDPDGDPLVFSWELVSAPKDSTATLSDPAAEQPELTPDLPGRYELLLVVDDGALSSPPDTTFVETLDIRPVAVTDYPNKPGQYESTHWRGDLVQVDGSGSWDPEGRPLSHEWTMVRRPAGSEAVIFEPTDPRPTFVADVFGEYDLMLVVSDGHRTSAPAWAFLAARNRDPIADPGPDRNAAIGETVTFDCSRSYDPDGDPIVCLWYLTPPAGSSVWIIGAPPDEWVESYEVAFVPDVPGAYWVDHQAVDLDGEVGWVTATVTVEAGTNPPVITTTPALSAVVGQPWGYDADATDPDPGDTATWSLEAAPAGMTVDVSTGEVVWTANAAQVGDHDVVLRVTDGTGLADDQPFTLTASRVPQPPRLGCPAELFVIAGETLGHMLSAADPNGDPLTFDKVSGPAAATVADGELLWPTTVGDSGIHTLVARVSDGALEDTCSIEIAVISEADDDGDLDGWSETEGDCDDTDPTVNPGAVDIAGDGIDQDCDGADATRSVDADGPTGTIDLLVGESVWIPHTIYVDRPSGVPGDLTLTQEVVPAVGLQLETDLDEAPPATASLIRVATVRITAVLPGDYVVTTTITDTLTGQQGVASTPVHVLDGVSKARMLAPGFVPGAVSEGTPTLVDIAVRMIDGDPATDRVWLDRTDAAGIPIEGVGWLTDNGGGADLGAMDGVFSGTILVPASPEGTLYYRAVTIGSPAVASGVAALPVTRFPVGPPDSNLDDVVFHPETGSPVLAGEVSVTFVAGATPTEIETVAADLGGMISGYLPEIGVYVLALPSLTSGDDLAARLATVEAHPLVDAVDYSGLVQLEEVSVPDPLQGDLNWTDPVHSTEAWVYGFGGSSVATAVVDTGIDRWHPDLKQNHRAGLNTLCSGDGCTVQDGHAHGTQVAGIIASGSNSDSGSNSIGFAGLLPDTSVLVEKAFDNQGRGTTLSMVDGLLEAASRGSRLINASFGEFRAETNVGLMTFADFFVYRRDALLIAAAGNENTSRPLFPAANIYSLAVGGVGINSDQRWNPRPRVGSNHGRWVDIAAPAENVFTTVPTTQTTKWNPDDPDHGCFDYDPPPGTSGYPLLPTLAERRAKGCYATVSGTSLSTPIVTGAAGLVLDRFPHYNALELRKRLEESAAPRTSPLALGLGHGLLNAEQAVFNGSFEAAEVHDDALMAYANALIQKPCEDWVEFGGWWWPLYRPCTGPSEPVSKPNDHGWHLMHYGGIPYQPINHADSIQGGTITRRIGAIVPPEGKYMGMLSTGRGAETYESVYVSGTDYWTAQYLDILEQTFTIAPGQTTISVAFYYDFVTEEQAYVAGRLDQPDNDFFSAVIEVNGRREVLALRGVWEMEDASDLEPVDGLTLSGSYPVRHTGWTPVSRVINLDPGETSPITIRFAVRDAGGRDLDSILLIDDVSIY